MRFAATPPHTCPQACPAGERSQPEQGLWVLEREDPRGVATPAAQVLLGRPARLPAQPGTGQPWHQEADLDGPAAPSNPTLPTAPPHCREQQARAPRARPSTLR